MSKVEDKYQLACPKCGMLFFPWEALMRTTPNTNWEPVVTCPNCGREGNANNGDFGKENIIYTGKDYDNERIERKV